MSTTTIVLSALFGLSSYFIYKRAFQKHPPYPPGPSPKPIIGNAFDIPFVKPWIAYRDMAKKYNSSLIHLSALGTHVVVANTLEDAVELLDKRSSNYSSRPHSPIFDLIGMKDLVMLLPYGNEWRKQRRLLERGLKKDTMPAFYHVQAEKVHLMLDQLLHDPADFKEHCKGLGTAVTMSIGFGYDVIPGVNDACVEPAEFAINKAAELMLPGRTLIAVFGFLRHIPPWFPGAEAQKLGAEIREKAIEYKNEPYGFTKRHMAAGTAKDSILKRILEANAQPDGSFKDEDAIQNAIATMYLGGVETMQITQTVFIQAMALYPEVQRKAQEEIDRVVGSARLPTLADRPSMPYVDAIFRETLRWKPSGPLGFGHSTLEDDVYKGYFIPKGTIVMPNVWAISYDEKLYPQPEVFRPERFIKPDGTLNDDTMPIAFGFGRRVCPGKHMADLVVWQSLVAMLAAFNISKAKDENGNEIPIDVDACTDSFTVHPLPFKCTIAPRSPQAESLVRSAAAVARHNMGK